MSPTRLAAPVAIAWTFLLLVSFGSAPTAHAMTFEYSTLGSDGARIIAKGEVARGDVARLLSLVVRLGAFEISVELGTNKRMLGPSRDTNAALLDGQRVLSNGWATATVELQSGGGDAEEGVRLGWAIRALGLKTRVPAGADCASACSFAFLGGTSRVVEGRLLIHSMSLDAGEARSDPAKALDYFQSLTSEVTAYMREMTGSLALAELTFSVPSRDIALVSDAALRDMSVITHAVRSSQGYPASHFRTLDCSASTTPAAVGNAVCNDLALARLDAKIAASLEKLQGPAWAWVHVQQPRWTAYRDRCAEASKGYSPRLDEIQTPMLEALRLSLKRSGELGVQACLSFAYGKRAAELEALAAYVDAGNIYEVRDGWRN